ncbi:MAG: SpaA isopeptide-forming pilin-related protein [Christensenellales bacterium]
MTLGDSAYTCDIVENEDGTRSLVMPANGGNTIHNTAALDGDNTVHPSVYAYNNYTVNLIYDKADFELDCDDERLDDAAFKGLGVTLDSTLNYTVYGDSDEKTADSSKTLYYHFVRQGGYILPEQYVKLAADVADRTAYSGSDAVFAIYKASEVKRNEKGELVLGENAKLSDRIGAFKTSRELPEGDYYVVRTGMEAGYTNVKPGDKKTIKIGEAFYPYQLVAVTAGAEEKAVKAEFEDYNAQNGQFILEKMFYAPDGTQNTNSSLSAEFTLTGQNGRTYTVKVENGKPTTVYLPADTYTMKETGVSDGFAKAADRIVVIEAGSQTRMTDDNAVKNYSTDGLLNLKAYLREYERGDNLEAVQSHYTVTITRDGETEPVKQTTLDEAESVYLPRFDGDGRLITYRVKVASNEQTDGLFYASSKNGEEEKPEAEIQITFTDDARIQNADYFFIKQQELTITKRLVDVSGLNKEQTWTITVQAACEAGDELPSQTVELTTDGKQNEASQTLSLRGWDENGHVVTYTVGEAAAEGYAVTYSEKSVTLDDGTDKTITVTNTRQVGKTTFTKEGSDNATLPGAVYAVLTQKADGKTYLVGRTLTDGVLTEKTAAIVDKAGRLTQPENVAGEYRFTTDADGRIELVLPVEEGTSYYLQELAAPENYYLNTELVWLTVAAGDDSQKAGQVDRRKYQLEVTKVFPDEVANGSFATFTLYDESMRQVGEPVTVRKPDQAVGVFTIPAYGTYYVRETAVSGDMKLNDSVFGPLTYSETDRADNLNVPNKANVGSLTVELRDEKKEKLGTQPAAIDYVNAADLAKFTVSVGASNLAEDSYAYRALLKTGFVLDETTNTLVYTGEKGARQAFKLSSLPIYGDPNDKTTALTYTVKQEQAAQRYFKAEDVQQFKLNENASQTLTFENEPKAALNVSLNYRKEYELERGNAPEYPLTGATMTLYEVKDDDTLEWVESFDMTNPTATISDLHGLKHYVLVETKVPDGYCAYESKDPDHLHSDNATYNREPHDYQDVLKNFKYVELTGEETDNQNDSQSSSITNYKDYVQLKLNKIGYTVQFADGAATEGVVVGETQPLDYCQFEVYAIRTSDLTEPQRDLLARNSAFIAPQAGKTVEKGTYTGREAELEAIFTAEPQKSKLITDGITYETGASGMGTGAFMTDAFELGDDVGEYTFLFREVKINHAGGYQKVYGGVWSAAATEVNAVTEVDAYNEADVLSGGETEFKGLFQVKLDKEYWPSTEAKDNNRVGELKPLAGVTFELLLARENANGLLEAVKGDGAFSTEFVTGCESGMSAGYGVSITVSLETLYTENGGADNPDNPVKLDVDENGQPFYEADFILREKDYPINMVYMQERYALHVKAVKNAQDADYVTVVDDYLNKDGQDNAIKNILGEMTYLTVAKYVDGERYYGGEKSTDAVYTITDAKGKVYTRVTLNNSTHYETTVQ